MRRTLASAAVLALGAMALTACAPVEEASDPAAAPSAPADDLDPASCVTDEMLLEPGVLTVGTDSPAYEPWFVDNDPTNGEGYESAVAYEVADRLGFSEDQVTWVKVPFNTSYAPGAKEFDLDINQISSAQTGTTSLTAIRDIIAPTEDPAVFEDTNAAKQALVNDQVDAILADLPTAFYISAVEIEDSVIVGQFQPDTAPPWSSSGCCSSGSSPRPGGRGCRRCSSPGRTLASRSRRSSTGSGSTSGSSSCASWRSCHWPS